MASKPVAFFVASKYLFSKKSRSYINIISIISVVSVALFTAAMIIVLSAFNGLEGLLRSLFATFDAEIQVSATLGKTFPVTDSLLGEISETEGVVLITEVLEDNALLRYREGRLIARVKGVSENFLADNRLKNSLVRGELKLEDPQTPNSYSVIGRGVQAALNIAPSDNISSTLQFFYPRNVSPSALRTSTNLYRSGNILVSGVFAIERQYDDRYVFVPLSFAEGLFGIQGRRTALEITTAPDYSVAKVQAALKEKLGPDFKVLNSDEQHASILRAVRIEKLLVTIILVIVLAVASFNIFFTLSMLAIEKKSDLAVLYAMGASQNLVRRIFLANGALIAASGAAIGLVLGFGIAWVQQQFGIIKMGMESAVMNDWPIEIQAQDFLWTAVSLILITFLASIRPAQLARRVQVREHL